MFYPSLLDADTLARRILAVVLGLVEVGLGAMRIKQGVEQTDINIVLDGLRAIAFGVQSILRGCGAEGGTWLDLATETRRLICLYFRFKGGKRYALEILQVLIEGMQMQMQA